MSPLHALQEILLFLHLLDMESAVLIVLSFHVSWGTDQIGHFHVIGFGFPQNLFLYFHHNISFPKTLSPRWLAGFFFFISFSSILSYPILT